MRKTNHDCKSKKETINSFPIPRGRILQQYAFKHDLLPENPKKRKVLMKYLEGKDSKQFKLEYD
jgi:hypothetical protein